MLFVVSTGSGKIGRFPRVQHAGRYACSQANGAAWQLTSVHRNDEVQLGRPSSECVQAPEIADPRARQAIPRVAGRSRCVIVETKAPFYDNLAFTQQNTAVRSEGDANQFDVRQSPAVTKNDNDGDGLPDVDPDDLRLGMGWFPGYAIDIETGERLLRAQFAVVFVSTRRFGKIPETVCGSPCLTHRAFVARSRTRLCGFSFFDKSTREVMLSITSYVCISAIHCKNQF